MTGEEMERAIEFLLQSQGKHESRMDELTAQVLETGRQLATYAETQSQFIEIVTTAMTNLADAQAATERTVNETNARLGETDARLNKLIGLFEQHIVVGH